MKIINSKCKLSNNTGVNMKVNRNYNENEIKTKNKKRTRRSKKKRLNTPDKEIDEMYSSERCIKSKVNSLKQILIKKPFEITALCETQLKQSEKVSITRYKQIGLNRKDKDGGGIGFLINNNIVKSCFVEPQTNEGIEIRKIRLELKHNKTSSYLQRDNHLLLLGYFNGKIGNDKLG